MEKTIPDRHITKSSIQCNIIQLLCCFTLYNTFVKQIQAGWTDTIVNLLYNIKSIWLSKFLKMARVKASKITFMLWYSCEMNEYVRGIIQLTVQYRNIFGQVPRWLAYQLVQYGNVIWARVQIYFGIVQSTV